MTKLATICRRQNCAHKLKCGLLDHRHANCRSSAFHEHEQLFERHRIRSQTGSAHSLWLGAGHCLPGIVLRVWLEPVLGKQAGLLFWAAILICPWIGGLVPSLIGQSMIWAAQWYWFTPPATTPWRPRSAELLFIAIYYLLRKHDRRRERSAAKGPAACQRSTGRSEFSAGAAPRYAFVHGRWCVGDRRAGSPDAHESGRGSNDGMDDGRIARQAAAGVFRRSSRRMSEHGR